VTQVASRYHNLDPDQSAAVGRLARVLIGNFLSHPETVRALFRVRSPEDVVVDDIHDRSNMGTLGVETRT
jgi:hypothetical protein